MKILVLIAALASLSACGGAATEETAPAEATVAEEAVVTTAADGGPLTGTFAVTNAAGEVSTEVLLEDGTYTGTNTAGEATKGVWEQRSPNEFCSQASDEEEMTCFAETMNEDGVWTSTNQDDGQVSTVERVEAEAETAED